MDGGGGIVHEYRGVVFQWVDVRLCQSIAYPSSEGREGYLIENIKSLTWVRFVKWKEVRVSIQSLFIEINPGIYSMNPCALTYSLPLITILAGTMHTPPSIYPGVYTASVPLCIVRVPNYPVPPGAI